MPDGNDGGAPGRLGVAMEMMGVDNEWLSVGMESDITGVERDWLS